MPMTHWGSGRQSERLKVDDQVSNWTETLTFAQKTVLYRPRPSTLMQMTVQFWTDHTLSRDRQL